MAMTKMQKPTKPCYCGANDWWQRADGGWNCNRCHPNLNLGSEPVPNEGKYSAEVLALRDRVIKGNAKLFQAWLVIRDIEKGEEKEHQLDRWNEAQERLQLLCQELKRHYSDCLYLNEDGKKTKRCLDEPDGFWCQVCPSSRKYSEEELMKL